MNSPQPSPSSPESAASIVLKRIRSGASPFAITKGRNQNHAMIFEGDLIACKTLSDIPRLKGTALLDNFTVDTIAAIPYAQMREKGMETNDATPIRCMNVQTQTHVSIHELLKLLPVKEINLTKQLTYRPDSSGYERRVKAVQDDAIGKGVGSSFTLSRKAIGEIADFNRDKLLSMFGSILRNEFGSYLSFVFDIGESALIGASPERHITVRDGTVVMNPISGTLRKSFDGLTRRQLISFLRDSKEINELFMVLDEELKLMAQMCECGGEIDGPHLLEMSKVLHTEYKLIGRSHLDPMELYRRSMFAPTVTGSPMSSAPGVISDYEDESRRYYSGTINMLGHYERGAEELDSAIAIRMAEITSNGTMTLQAGATIVRDSVPCEEAKETEGKLAGMLHAILHPGSVAPQKTLASILTQEIYDILRERNAHLSDYFFYNQEHIDRRVAQLIGKTITIIDNGDDFCHMLRHMMVSMGTVVRVVSYKDFDPLKDAADIVVIGPGPGDPTDIEDIKMKKIADITNHLLQNDRKFLGVCLGHQMLCRSLAMPLICKEKPMQGIQKLIELFGKDEFVGFYNTFTAQSVPMESIEQSIDPDTNDVYSLKGKRFASFQFHPESVLSENGFYILKDALVDLIHS